MFNVSNEYTDVVAYLQGNACETPNNCDLSQVECVPNSCHRVAISCSWGLITMKRFRAKYDGRAIRFKSNDDLAQRHESACCVDYFPSALPTEIASAQQIQSQFQLAPLKVTQDNKTQPLTNNDIVNPFNSPPITPESIAFFDLIRSPTCRQHPPPPIE